MPHVSRNPLSPKVEKEVVENLNLILSSINKGDDMVSFLNSLLTTTEKIMLGKRLAVVILIEEDMKDSEISRMLHLTEVTVVKMRLFYEARGQGFKIALKKLEEQKRLKAFKDTLLELAEFIGKSGSGHIKRTFGSNKFE